MEVGQDRGHGVALIPGEPRCFLSTPAQAPVTWKKIQPRPLEQVVPPVQALVSVEWKNRSQGLKNTLNRRNSLTARSREPEGTTIGSFHFIISQLSQKVEVLIKQGLLNSSVYGNVLHSHQRGDKQAWEREHKIRKIYSSECMCGKIHKHLHKWKWYHQERVIVAHT